MFVRLTEQLANSGTCLFFALSHTDWSIKYKLFYNIFFAMFSKLELFTTLFLSCGLILIKYSLTPIRFLLLALQF